MTWGAYVQNNDLQEIEVLGAQLSLEINCPAHYPAYNKHLFECKCNITFPVFLVKSGDWDKVREIHEKGR